MSTAASQRPATLLLPKPYYPAFPRIAQLLGLDCKFYEAQSDDGSASSAAASMLVRENPGCTIIWNFPHNPTGAIDDPVHRAKVMAAVEEVGGEMIQDLVYGDLVYAPFVAPSGPPVEAEVRVYSLSKSHGLAGERIGYVVASEGRSREIERAHWAFTMSPPATSQALALHALEATSTTARRLARQLHGLRDEACDRLEQHGEIDVRRPAGGIFLWLEVPALNIGGDALAMLCRQAGLLVVPGSAFGVDDRAAVRMSFAVERATLLNGIDLFIALTARVLSRSMGGER